VRNLNDGINMVQTAEGAMVEQSNMLQRMRELAVQAMNGTYSNTQRSYLDKEFQALTEQIDRISKDTMWNDQKLLAGGGYIATLNASSVMVPGPSGLLTLEVASGAGIVDFANNPVISGQSYFSAGGTPLTLSAGTVKYFPADGSIVPSYAVSAYAAYDGTTVTGYYVPVDKIHTQITVQAGKDQDQTITVDIVPMNAHGFGISGLAIATFDTATATLDKISTALETINNQRAGLGAAINQMAYAADNLTNVSSNATQSRSTIMDTDYALATTQLAKTQIIQQAATAMLAQANQQPQSVMALLKG